jgi:hypothetical protein
MVGGTGVIRGRVTGADTGAPMGRATVMLMGAGQRQTFTDSEGRYAFTGVPAGSYTLMVNPGDHRAGYQNMFGPASMANAPKRLQLADGQVIENLDIRVPRAGVITGRVFDPSGEPAGRVQVSALIVRPGMEPQQMAAGVSTDDLGQFRLFGLVPGVYIVRADMRMGMGMGGGPLETEGQPTGFAPTYAPGTPVRGDAMRIRVAAGMEAAADVRLLETRVFKITGSVIASTGEAPTNVTVSLATTEGGTTSSFGTRVMPNGTFTFQNVVPGSYDIVARVQERMAGPTPAGPPAIQEMGTVRVDVSTTDLDNVMVPMRRGETVTGEIAFEGEPPPRFNATVSFQPVQRSMFGLPGRSEVKESTFTVRDLFGPVVVRGSVFGTPTPWALKAVLLEGRDITDVPTAFTAAHSGRLQLVFSSALPTLEGIVLDDSGKPAQSAQIVVFSEDEDGWVPMSSRIRSTVIGRDDGKFTMRGLREGRYYVVALSTTAMTLGMQRPDRELMESLKKVATAVVLDSGETRTVELRVVRMEQ